MADVSVFKFYVVEWILVFYFSESVPTCLLFIIKLKFDIIIKRNIIVVIHVPR